MKYPNGTDFFCHGQMAAPVAWCVFCVACVLVGLPACAWLLWVLKKQSKRSASGSSSGSGSGSGNIYLLNLTVLDLLFDLILIPVLINYFFFRDMLVFLLGLFFSCVSLFGRPLFMACICVDCYMAVVHPVFYMKIRGRAGTYRTVLSALVWVLMVVFGYFMVWGSPIATMLSLITSAPVIVFCNLSVLWALRKPDPSGKTEVHPQKQRAMQVVVNSLLVTLISYPPTLVANTVYGLGLDGWDGTDLFCKLFLPSLIAPSSGSTIMPVLNLSYLGHGLKCIKVLGSGVGQE